MSENKHTPTQRLVADLFADATDAIDPQDLAEQMAAAAELGLTDTALSQHDPQLWQMLQRDPATAAQYRLLQAMLQSEANAPLPTGALPPRPLLPVNQTVSTITPEAGWVLTLWEQGQAWVEPLTRRWRQVQFTLPPFAAGWGNPLVAAGLQGDDAATADATAADADASAQSLHLQPTGADFQMTVTLQPTADADSCHLNVTVTAANRFDLAGILVALQAATDLAQANTDELGRVTFHNRRRTEIATARLILRFPA